MTVDNFNINEYLTKSRKLLLRKSKRMAKNLDFKFIWTNDIDIIVAIFTHIFF